MIRYNEPNDFFINMMIENKLLGPYFRHNYKKKYYYQKCLEIDEAYKKWWPRRPKESFVVEILEHKLESEINKLSVILDIYVDIKHCVKKKICKYLIAYNIPYNDIETIKFYCKRENLCVPIEFIN